MSPEGVCNKSFSQLRGAATGRPAAAQGASLPQFEAGTLNRHESESRPGMTRGCSGYHSSAPLQSKNSPHHRGISTLLVFSAPPAVLQIHNRRVEEFVSEGRAQRFDSFRGVQREILEGR